MIRKQKAFTLFEVLLSLVVMTSIIVAIAPNLKNTIFDHEEPRVQRTYAQILAVIQNLNANTVVYPDSSGFSNQATITDPMSKEVYGGATKFAEMFMSQLNIRQNSKKGPSTFPIIDGIGSSSVPIACDSYKVKTDDCLPDALERDIDKNLICFTTNDGTTYCLPANTTDIFANSDRLAIIRVYYKDSFKTADEADKAGYYFGVSATGKVSPMSVNSAVSELFSGREEAACFYRKDYNEVAQCRLDDYLSDR